MKLRTKQEIEKAVKEAIAQLLETQLGDRLEVVVTQAEEDAGRESKRLSTRV
jgi:hypothetical protein